MTPDRIWAWREVLDKASLNAPLEMIWCEPDAAPYEAMDDAEQYILVTPEALAASPEVQALIAEAVAKEREACADQLEARVKAIASDPGTLNFWMSKIFQKEVDAIRNRKDTPPAP